MAATGGCAGISMHRFKELWNRENLWALALCVILAALTVLTADLSPTWIYQGF